MPIWYRPGKWIFSMCRRMRSTRVISTLPRAEGSEDVDQTTPGAPLPPAEGRGRVWQALALAVPGAPLARRRDQCAPRQAAD